MFRSLLLLALCALPCAADQLYVRNRPFPGASSKLDGGLWVELEPLAKALGANLVSNGQGGYALSRTTLPADAASAVPANKVQVGTNQVDVQVVDGSARVPLDDAARALEARVTNNKQLGTIDVSLPVSAQSVASTAGAAAAPMPSGNVVRIHGRMMKGATAVGLFEGGSSSTPYKLGVLDGRGNYVMDIDLDKDLHSMGRGLMLTDMRFFRNGAFDQFHGRCNFVTRRNGKISLEVYEGPTFEIKNRDLEYTEND